MSLLCRRCGTPVRGSNYCTSCRLERDGARVGACDECGRLIQADRDRCWECVEVDDGD